jgi:hypothetical protein
MYRSMPCGVMPSSMTLFTGSTIVEFAKIAFTSARFSGVILEVYHSKSTIRGCH